MHPVNLHPVALSNMLQPNMARLDFHMNIHPYLPYDGLNPRALTTHGATPTPPVQSTDKDPVCLPMSSCMTPKGFKPPPGLGV